MIVTPVKYAIILSIELREECANREVYSIFDIAVFERFDVDDHALYSKLLHFNHNPTCFKMCTAIAVDFA